jgi:CBS domain-containing protein
MDAHEELAVVRSVMTPTIYTISPSDSAQSAARLMAETGVGFLPVEYPPVGAILGVISDRDIVVSVMAQGLPTTTPVREFMVVSAETCSPDDSIVGAAQQMIDSQIRRLVVVDDARQPVGILSLENMARADPGSAARVLARTHIRRGPRPREEGSNDSP